MKDLIDFNEEIKIFTLTGAKFDIGDNYCKRKLTVKIRSRY